MLFNKFAQYIIQKASNFISIFALIFVKNNLYQMVIAEDEWVFAEDVVQCYGQVSQFFTEKFSLSWFILGELIHTTAWD